jgi:hypothetical protein
MPIKDCPFTPLIVKRPYDIGPMLWIRVSNPATGQAVIFKALVDTGAYSCAFPADVATMLGHKLKSVAAKTVDGAGGPTKAYSHTSRVEILEMLPGDLPSSTVLYTIQDTPIDFVVGLKQFLLGVNNFLANFILTVDYPHKIFSIRKPAL